LPLSPAIQDFGIDAADYLAGIDEMLDWTDALAKSIDGLVASAGGLQGTFDGLSAADARLAETLSAADEAAARLAETGSGATDAVSGLTTAAETAAEAETALADAGRTAADAQLSLLDVINEEAEAARTGAGIQGELFDAIDLAAQSARAAAAAEELLADAEKAASDAAAFEAGLLADLQAQQALLDAGTAVLTDSLAVEAKALKTVADSAALAGDAMVTAGAESDEAAGEMDTARDSAAGLGSTMKLALLGIGAGLIYGVVKASEFQTQVTRLYTAAGLTGTGIKQVSAQIMKIGDATGFTGTQIAEALYHPVSAGMSLKAALAAVTDGAQLAQIHGADLDDTMYALSSVMKAFNIQAGGAGHTAALLNAIVGEGDMRFQDFNSSVSNWAPTASSMGISIQSMGAALAYLTDRGNGAQSAATRLSEGLTLVTAGSKEANTFLKALGLTSGSVSLQNKTLASVMNGYGLTTNKVAADLKQPDGIYVALSQIQDAFKKSGLSASEADQVMAKIFGGGRSDKAILSLMQNLGGLKSKYDDITKSVGDYGSSWSKTQATTGYEWKQTVSDAENLATTFGAMLLPAVDKVLGYLSRFMAVLQQHKVLAEFAGGLIAVFAAMELVSVGAKMFGAIMEAGPVILVIAAIAALGIGLYELYTHFKTVRDIVADVGKFFASTWTASVHAAGDVITWFTNGPLAWIKAQVALFTGWWDQHGQEIEQLATDVWHAISAVVTEQWRICYDMVIRPGLVALESIWRTVWGLVSDTALLAWRTISAVTAATVHIILDVVAVALDLLTGHWSQAWSDLQKLAHDALYGISNVISTFTSGALTLLVDAGKNIVEGLIHGIESMASGAYDAIKSVGSGIKNTFMSAIHALSPSKDFYQFGVWIVQGLGNGITETAQQAVDKSRQLAEMVKQGYLSKKITSAEATELLGEIMEDLTDREGKLNAALGKIGLSIRNGLLAQLENAGSESAVKTAIGKLVTDVQDAFSAGDITLGKASALTTWLDDDNSRLYTLAAKRKQLENTIAAADKYAATTTSNTESWASLSNVTSSMTSGGMVYSGNILAGMQTDLSTISQFSSALKKLGNLGLSKNLLNQIIQMGPSAGLQTAQALIDGPLSVIRSMNSTQSAINSYSTQLGQTSADLMYDSGKMAGKGFLSGLQAQQASITKMMDQIAKSMIETIEKDLKIHSPSLVTTEHGEMIAMGLVNGLEHGVPWVKGAMHMLSAAATPGNERGAESGGSGSAGNTTITIQVHVDGYVGDNQQLATEIYRVMQEQALQHERRNGVNGLSLPF
jgi:TP901 family phage tail tape measure protein